MNDIKIFSCAAIIPDNGIRTLLDKGVRVMLDTQELTPEQGAMLFSLKGGYGNFYFVQSDLPVKASEIGLKAPDVIPDFKGEKSPSQRLRNRMYVYYTKKNETEAGFLAWYAEKLDEIGQVYLDKSS